jgi:hypothetical protein
MSVCAASTKSLPSATSLLLIDFLQVSCPSNNVSSSYLLCSATTRNVCVQKHVFDKSMSSGMTRVAGASLAAASSYAMLAGFSGSGTDRRRACRVVAVHSAVGAGVCATQLLATSHITCHTVPCLSEPVAYTDGVSSSRAQVGHHQAQCERVVLQIITDICSCFLFFISCSSTRTMLCYREHTCVATWTLCFRNGACTASRQEWQFDEQG